MNQSLLIVGAITLVYIALAISYALIVSKMDDGIPKKRLQNLFIGFNIALFAGGVAYALLNFNF